MIRQLSLVKGKHNYVFRYLAGEEDQVISVFSDMASDPEQEFDWFDATVLSYQIGRRLEIDDGIHKI